MISRLLAVLVLVLVLPLTPRCCQAEVIPSWTHRTHRAALDC